MKKTFYTFLLLFFVITNIKAQNSFQPSVQFPYGQPNPEAPSKILDFAPMIGICDCESYSVMADGNWAEPVPMTWTFKYIMNGMAIQDETLRADSIHSGSIRQYSSDSARWYVHYYSTTRISSMSSYQGNRQGDQIVLYKTVSDITTEDGQKLFYRLTFSDINANGFEWIGQWVLPQSDEDTVLGSTWKISCKKRE